LKKRLGLIGVGRVAKKYLKGLQNNPFFELIAVSDVIDIVLSDDYYHKFPFYRNYQEMLKTENPDYVLIATPPQTHFDIAIDCINKGINVITEKPGAFSLSDLYKLVELSKSKQLVFDVLFHYRYGNEIRFFQKLKYDFGLVKKVIVQVHDPYLDKNNQVINEYLNLGGAWTDSGLNVLSLLSMFFPLAEFQLLDSDFKYDDAGGTIIKTTHLFKYQSTLIETDIVWDDINHKSTVFQYENGNIVIEHTAQTIYINNEVVFDESNKDRLSAQYEYYFQTFDDQRIDTNLIIDLHKMFFALTNQ
jgi:predicted dehydrogenase